MTSMAAPVHDPGSGQRLGATLALSVALHAVVLLGVGFTLHQAAPVVPTLDVILTRTTTALTPEQADFLAQASNVGGGEHEHSTRPRENQSGPLPQPSTGLAARQLRAQAPDQQPPPEARVVDSARGQTPAAAAQEAPEPEIRPLPRGPERVAHDMEMARLAAEIHLRSEQYARRPTRKFVSASTTEYAWAGYLREWVDRVERVGNLTYPDEARRRQLAGEVVISVAVRRDGSVEQSRILRSSGIPLLDDSALRIASLAEPYPPLPRTDENPDILHVTRTWAFLSGGELVDR